MAMRHIGSRARRGPKALGSRLRSRRRTAGGRSESLADVPHRPRLPSYPPIGPTDRLHDLYGSLSRTFGINPARIAFERAARNTRENALLAMALAQPQAGETWLLVTSASHMPRAMGSFGRAGWRVTAYPVDYLTAGPGRWRPGFSLMHGLSLLTLAEKEWIGLAAYRLLGWTDRLFPDPGDV